jgi:uncharacterized protein (DUF362 family)|tara:strand:- start:4100 stop:5020 length:921 start_codon:yes stop_codon:yes gene_type:complete
MCGWEFLCYFCRNYFDDKFKDIFMEVYLERSDNLEKNLRTVLRNISWRKIISPNEKVLIKPNFCTHQLEKGVTTNIDLLKILVDIVSKRTSNVVIGETHSVGKKFEKLIARFDIGCDFINLSNVDSYCHIGVSGTYNLPMLAVESKIINVPVLKTHTLTGVTMGIKNIFGLIQDKDKSKYHYKIHDVLADLVKAIPPDINILDASNSHSDIELLLASRDVVSLDIAGCNLLGLDPLSIKYISLLSNIDNKVEIQGDSYEDLKLHVKIPIPDRAEKIAMYLQGNVLTRKILGLPGVHYTAKKIKKRL